MKDKLIDWLFVNRPLASALPKSRYNGCFTAEAGEAGATQSGTVYPLEVMNKD